MNKAQLVVRLIALWLVFIMSSLLVLWSFSSLVKSSVVFVKKGYEINYNYSYNSGRNSCLLFPNYPQSQADITDEKDVAMTTKYNQDLEKYYQDYRRLCEEDIAKQNQASEKQSTSEENRNRSLALAEVVSYLAFLALSLTAAIKTEEEIKRSEQAYSS